MIHLFQRSDRGVNEEHKYGRGDPWVVYRTRLDLLDEPEDSPEVVRAHQEMVGHPKILSLAKELTNWPGTVLSSHKSARQPMHKLSFLADLGLRCGDPYIDDITKRILEHQSKEGPFQLAMNISTSYGGTGTEQWAWALCDAPVVLYSLVRFGLGNTAAVQKGVKYLTGLIRENGFSCAVSPELGKFRGPGRKEDPCPYANLAMVKTLAQMKEWNNIRESHIAAETLLGLWEKSRELHPYMFYMGTDFRKLKAPLVWYDIVHALDVLTQFPWLKQDSRLKEMVDVVSSKADEQGRFTPESIWQVWKDWDFGQKKQPSRWLTFLVRRILKRVA